ncbi:hypothetical protein BDV32DRAFT_138809 [Aspergillus pseudonomiae]|nr:hypothetical protein BDV32DRAFT_138809 [Aspergillus pseudonomiae]
MDPMRALLEDYSKIPPEGVTEAVKEAVLISPRPLAKFPYPCIGKCLFINFSLPTIPCYDEVLCRTRQGQKLLDLGCGFGQELRLLTYRGARSETLYGVDLRPEFIDLGYDLFKDRNTLKSHFITADILADEPLAISQLSGSINIVHASFLFHLFNWDQQVLIAKQALALLCARPDSLIIGQNIGHQDPNKFSAVGAILPFHHNASSWKALWDHVREVTGVAFSMQPGVACSLICCAITVNRLIWSTT